MNSYLDVIEQVMYFFPILLILVAIPYFYIQYKKNRYVELYSSLITFSFILYLTCCYGLVILPLPTIEEVSQMTGPYVDLRLFGFVEDFFKYAYITSDPSTVLTSLKGSLAYIPFFNLIMLIPFGIYQKKFFNNSLIKTTFYAFLLSLSFELIQLSALFGIFPHPYRLFQLDDLILNTAGAVLGWIFTPKGKVEGKIQLKSSPFAPSQKERFIVFGIDIVAFFITFKVISFILKGIFGFNGFFGDYLLYFITVIIYFVILPINLNFKTPAGSLLNLSYTSRLGRRPRIRSFILRQFFLFGLILPAPMFALYINYTALPVIVKIPLMLIMVMIPIIVCIQLFMNTVLAYETFSRTYLTSDRKKNRYFKKKEKLTQDQRASLSSSARGHQRV